MVGTMGDNTTVPTVVQSFSPSMFILPALSLLTALLSSTNLNPSLQRAAQSRDFGNVSAIAPDRLRDHLEFIASDELEGRDTPSRGLDVATLYVATQLKLWGATPAGDNGTFFQKVPVIQRTLDRERSVINFGEKSYRFGDGFMLGSKAVSANGNIVYVGHGYIFKKKGIDPYQGVDVRGKIVVVAAGLPKEVTNGDMQGTEGSDYSVPTLAAKRRGALAVLTAPTKEFISGWKSDDYIKLGGLTPASEADNDPALPNAVMSPDLTRAVFQGEPVTADSVISGKDAPERSFEMASSKRLSVNIVEDRQVWNPRNVVAIVPGSDPSLKGEYVAFGAHIDHVGMAPEGSGDRIFNGADDDGSGTVSILEIAHALLTGPRPKRSCLFVWHIGEEKDLWGSDHFTKFPTVNLKNVVTQLNIDMIGRSKKLGDTNPANAVLTGPNEIYVVGSTKMSTDLQKFSESVNASFLKLAFNYKYDDPKDPEQIFYRSDHYNYARKGIPIIFYFDGVHEDYHQPSDEVSKIDFTKMSRVAQTVFATGWTIANAPKRPVVDKPLKS